MKFKTAAFALLLSSLGLFSSCQDDISNQGGSLVDGEVTIIVDSIPTNIEAKSIIRPAYDARSTTKLVGRVEVPEYGKLDCSFLASMYPSASLNIPDSITAEKIDSLRLVFFVPRKSLTGDSLAPQQLSVYRLNKQLPADITNSADPTQYYSETDIIGSKSYTLSMLGAGDSTFKHSPNIRIPIKLPKESAIELYNAYKNDPELFQWPQNLAQKFPGIYVKQTFGNGCIANVSQVAMLLYYQTMRNAYFKNPETDSMEYRPQVFRDSTCLMISSPEVTSSNVIRFNMSQTLTSMVEAGKNVITTPGGYTIDMRFPAKEILERYYAANHGRLTVVSSLSIDIPADPIENDYGINPPPYLLMVKTSELADFFQNNKIPDSKTSFYAPYDSANKRYIFPTLRDYILDFIKDGKSPTQEDMEFSLVPVAITTESVDNYGTTTTYVTKCSNYISGPSMTELHLDRAIVNFTYSKQVID